MPLYEFECNKCGGRFTRILPVGSTEHSVRCTRCNSEEVRRLLSSFNAKTSGMSSQKGCGHAGFS